MLVQAAPLVQDQKRASDGTSNEKRARLSPDEIMAEQEQGTHEVPGANTTGNGKYARYWGALGYIINKNVVKPFLDDVVTHDTTSGLNSYKLVNSFFERGCKRTRDRPCVLANCLFSDTYIYSGAGPTYVHNVPLITSGKAASTSHRNHIEAHLAAFRRIEEITKSMRDKGALLKCQGK